MALKIGEINRLQVLRKTNIAYLLKSELGEEVFLHLNETNHRELIPNEYIDAFIYIDNKKGVAATLTIPYITIDKPQLLEVKSVKEDLGVFLDMGISKDLLLSRDYLTDDESIWPLVGDKVLVELKIKDKMSARLIPYHELSSNNDNLVVGDQVQGYIQVISRIGLFMVTEEMNVILIKNANYRGKYHIGEKVVSTITYKSNKGYEGSLVKQKEELRVDDSKVIIDYLINHDKQMPYTSDSTSEEITKEFNMSRKAFKRALGLLYKKRIVNFVDNYTILIGEENE